MTYLIRSIMIFAGQTSKDAVVYFALPTTLVKIHHTVPAATRGVSSSSLEELAPV
jgi:hypothetical protein